MAGMANNTTPTPIQTKKPKGSITGFVLAILSLIASGFGSLLVHANFHSKQPLTTTSEKVGDTVAAGTGHVVSSLISVPFLAVGIALAIIAAVFVLARLGKHLKAGGLVFSVVSILLGIWSFSVAVNAFSLLKAR